MIFYYRVFGVISVLALTVNVMLLIALLSMLQATMTLPGIAAVALALGMAIDSNVLINERVREELRNGRTPQQAITEGYEKAFATILDSNVTTLIAGIALLTFGSDRCAVSRSCTRSASSRRSSRRCSCRARWSISCTDRARNCSRSRSARSGNRAPDADGTKEDAPWSSSAFAARFRSCGTR